jgi:hypothetical protein
MDRPSPAPSCGDPRQADERRPTRRPERLIGNTGTHTRTVTQISHCKCRLAPDKVANPTTLRRLPLRCRLPTSSKSYLRSFPGASTPLNTRLMRDVAADPKATQMLLLVLNHEIRPSQLFTTPMVVRAAARALRDRPDRLIATLREILSAGRENARRARHRRIAPAGMGVRH